MRSVTFRTAVFLAACIPLCAGPKEFGEAELSRAIHERGIHLQLDAQVRPGSTPAEGYELAGRRLMANDVRGLMYGLLEAATQIRRDGRLTDRKESPRVTMHLDQV